MRRVRLPGPIRLDFEPSQHRGSFAVTPAPSRYKDSAVGLETGVHAASDADARATRGGLSTSIPAPWRPRGCPPGPRPSTSPRSPRWTWSPLGASPVRPRPGASSWAAEAVVQPDADGTGRRFFIIVEAAEACPNARTSVGRHDASGRASCSSRTGAGLRWPELCTGSRCRARLDRQSFEKLCRPASETRSEARSSRCVQLGGHPPWAPRCASAAA
jgi:hypothetical protein